MRTYPIPFNEEQRSAAVQNVPGLTRENHDVFDNLCRATAALLDCPIAHISVVEEDKQWYKSVVGIDLSDMPKDNSFCTHTIMSDSPMVITDLSKDPKFSEHPMVAEGGPQARFYAGVPLVLSSGYRFGSLCALDLVPHEMPSDQLLVVLEHLGKSVVAALEKAPAAPAVTEDEHGHSTFLNLVGHELRTPLTIVNGGLKLLEHRIEDDVVKQLAKSSIKSTDHLAKLINSILKFSDVSTGELQLNEQYTDLGALLTNLVETHATALADAHKSIEVTNLSTSRSVLLDPEHINICVTSLLLNSVLHGGDTVELSCTHDAKGHIEIHVIDDGHIDEHVELAELYKPFIIGGDVERRGTGGGLGLGLPLTRKLVELHGGEFEVRSEVDRTVACIRLPKWRELN